MVRRSAVLVISQQAAGITDAASAEERLSLEIFPDRRSGGCLHGAPPAQNAGRIPIGRKKASRPSGLRLERREGRWSPGICREASSLA